MLQLVGPSRNLEVVVLVERAEMYEFGGGGADQVVIVRGSGSSCDC
jgi:hypothetical protein